MGELSGPHPASSSEFGVFARHWLPTLVAVFLRGVRQPALAYDLATETLAGARLRWKAAPADEEAVAWLFELGSTVLDAAVDRGRVPSIDRRRGRQPAPYPLTAAMQQEIMALAEAPIELPSSARDAADAITRMAPPKHVLEGLRLSGIVEADPLPEHRHSGHGT